MTDANNNSEYDIELLNIEYATYNACIPSIFIFKVFAWSTLSAFLICKLCNYPFANPSKDSQLQLSTKVTSFSKVGACIIMNYNIIYFTLSQYYLHNNDSIIDVTNNSSTDLTSIFIHNLVNRIWSVMQFVFIVEFIAYWYHRFSHEITLIYKNSHRQHHVNINVYPIDFLEIDYIDNVAQTLYMNLPLYIVPMNITDYAIIYYIYVTSAFLVHSNVLTTHHTIHHRRFKYNYSLLLPIFDVAFNTHMAHDTRN